MSIDFPEPEKERSTAAVPCVSSTVRSGRDEASGSLRKVRKIGPSCASRSVRFPWCRQVSLS